MSIRARPLTNGSVEYGHAAPLLARLTSADDALDDQHELRAELAVIFLPVVAHIADRCGGRGEPLDDLRQVGTAGLLGALARFVPPPHVTDIVAAFLGFAVPTVTGEIGRHCRSRAWSTCVPRRLTDLQELQSRIRGATATLSADLRRAPRPSEIAAHLDVELEEVLAALRDTLPLDVPAGPVTVVDVHGRLDTALERVAYHRELRAALDELTERERQTLVMRFFDDLSPTQIAAELGISQMHASRMLSRSLATLRCRMSTK